MFWIGIITVISCVFGGYVAMGGKLIVLWQPWEFVIIGGAGLGAFIIANPVKTIIACGTSLKRIVKRITLHKEDYVELLTLLNFLFKFTRTQGIMALEPHIENPQESNMFMEYPQFYANKHALGFLCDSLRLVLMGSEDVYQMEALMEEEIETFKKEGEHIASAFTALADSLPAIGIVAAVLGVIKTMGAITEPPEVLGALLGAALFGTFLGIFLSYGFVGPIAQSLHAVHEEDIKYLQCIKSSLVAFLSGVPPAIAVEHGRKMLYSEVRPTFHEIDEAIQKTPKNTS